ncbi:MAG: ABC transporter substrate-binding protein, partial [Firmicutes bacterium]|nr:ABC transporter substrate-binding protein [Bacillota bacterium]
PFAQSYGGNQLIFIRGDLRKQYNLPEVKSLADFENYLKGIAANTKLIPFALRSDPANWAVGITYDGLYRAQHPEFQYEYNAKGIWRQKLAAGSFAWLYVQDYKVVDAYITAESVADLKTFPAPFNTSTTDLFSYDLASQKLASKWYSQGLIDKDVVNCTNAQALFTSGAAASYIWDVANYGSTATNLAKSVPNSVLEVWNPDILTANNIKGGKEGAFQVANFVCIPVTTPKAKADKIMKFFDWLFSDLKNNDLFAFGIEGVNFTAVGTTEYSYDPKIDMSKNYAFPGYQLVWNANFVRFPIGFPDAVTKALRASAAPDTWYKPLFSGFRFNSVPVKNQMANPDLKVAAGMLNALSLGIYPDVNAEFAKIDATLTANKNLQQDIQAIKVELIKQANAYLAVRKAEDQKNGTKYPTMDQLPAIKAIPR